MDHSESRSQDQYSSNEVGVSSNGSSVGDWGGGIPRSIVQWMSWMLGAAGLTDSNHQSSSIPPLEVPRPDVQRNPAGNRTTEPPKKLGPVPTSNRILGSASKRTARNEPEQAYHGIHHDDTATPVSLHKLLSRRTFKACKQNNTAHDLVDREPVESLLSATNRAQSLLDDGALQDAVVFFGEYIITMLCGKTWFESATLFHPQKFVCRKIHIALARLLPSSIEGAYTKEGNPPHHQMPHEFRRRLARYIYTNAQKAYLTGASKDNAPRVPCNVPPSILRTLEELGICTGIDQDIASDFHFANDGYSHVFRDSLFSSFCLTLRRVLYDANSPILSYIKATVINTLSGSTALSIKEASNVDLTPLPTNPDPLPSLTIDTDWQPLEFLDNQFGQNIPPIASIVTYTGFVDSAFAATCSDYVETFWPLTGPLFLRALQRLMDSSDPRSNQAIVTDETHSLQLSMSLSTQGCLSVQATSSVETLVHIAQQTVWICSAFRLSPASDTMFHCDGDISDDKESSHDGTSQSFYVSCQLLPTPPDHHSCWREIVDQTAVLCQHFPIPPRHNEAGLEVSLEMLCAMTGVRHAIEFNGGIVMKSLQGMLIPISLRERIVQWHYVCAEDDTQRFTYQEGISKCSERALMNSVNFETLRSTRAIVGWCRNASKIIGRDDAIYSTISYSTARPFSSSINFSGGALGFQQFGAAQLNFTLGPKDTKLVFRRSGSFDKILKLAGRSRVLLQDTEEKRAWLVNADDVILHIVQTRLYHDYESTGSPPLLEYLDTATQTLQSNENWHALGSNETIGLMVADIWSMLEILLDRTMELNQTPDRAVKMPFQKALIGFEFMGVVEERSPLETKQYTAKSTSGGWTRLIRDTGTLVLFSQGFHDLIEQVHTQGGCFAWRRIPKGEDYLGTTVSVLKDLYNVAGSKSDHRYLTSSGLYWRSENTVFERCPEAQSRFCRCNRLQDISHSDSHPTAAPTLEMSGGVVFGKPSSYSAPKRLSGPKSRIHNNSALYTLVNTTISSSALFSDRSEDEYSSSEKAEGSRPGDDEPDLIVTPEGDRISKGPRRPDNNEKSEGGDITERLRRVRISFG